MLILPHVPHVHPQGSVVVNCRLGLTQHALEKTDTVFYKMETEYI